MRRRSGKIEDRVKNKKRNCCAIQAITDEEVPGVEWKKIDFCLCRNYRRKMRNNKLFCFSFNVKYPLSCLCWNSYCCM